MPFAGDKQKYLRKVLKLKRQRERRAERRKYQLRPLTILERKFLKEYLKCGKKSVAARSAYRVSPKNANLYANKILRRKPVADALEKALKAHHLDDDFGVQALRNIIESGTKNRLEARPGDALKGLEMYWKLQGRLGTNVKNVNNFKINAEAKARKMSYDELKKELERLSLLQQQLLQVEEGEIVDGE